MTAKYCYMFFYPKVTHSKCNHMLSVSGICNTNQICPYQLNLSKEGFAKLDSLKKQKLAYMRKNKKMK